MRAGTEPLSLAAYSSFDYDCLCSSRLVVIDGVVSQWLLLL